MNASATVRNPYRIVSADQHVNEPPDLWTSRVPAKFKERAPRQQRFEEGDAWIIEGVADPINFGMNACAGLEPENQRTWLHWEQVRKGGYIGSERLAEMDCDGIDAALLFPSPRPSIGIIANRDREYQLAMIRAYNDWLAEFVSANPSRLFGMIWLPATGEVKDAVAELDRCLQMPGMIAPTINCYPNGTTVLQDVDDPLWATLAERNLPLTIHVTLADQPPTMHKTKVHGTSRQADAQVRMMEFMFAGVLDRFPDFKVVFTEVDAGWVPFFKEQTDNRFHRQSRASNFSKRPPSEYFDEHYYYAYVSDAYAIRNLDLIGSRNLLWSDDFPHLGGDWPHTQRGLVQSLANVAREDRELILAGNATRLYNLPGLPA